MGVVFIRVHEPDAVRDILDTAYGMAGEITQDEREFVHVFEKAADLLAARTMLMQETPPMTMPPPPLDLRRRH